MSITVAGAPVSFGVFELTPDDPELALPAADEVCRVLHESGYAGVDLGPVGFLGTEDELRRRLTTYELELAGGWVELPFSDDDAFAAALPFLDEALAVFTTALDLGPSRAPLPTLADAGDPVRKANPGGGAGHRLDRASWGRFAKNLTTAVERVRAVGLEPTFHHHACTFVETPEEIDTLLQVSDVGLTFDTGHLLIGGGDVLDGWQDWGHRVNHLHLKDVRMDVLRSIVARNGGMLDVWSQGTFVPFGAGDLDLSGLMKQVLASGYDGWLVVEQDLLPDRGTSLAGIVADHERNRELLRRWL
ncbi:MAG: sugar phosphate isomerase/epimerase [Actinomycetia bacterium]|nr:sugar phosphate isomerase/epimerase [Actinomycetes bacterium]